MSDEGFFGREVRYVGIVLLGALLFGCTIGYTGNTEEAFIENKEMDKDQFTWFASMMNIGAMVGSLASGPLANKFGRKKLLLATAVVFTIGYAVLAAAPHGKFGFLFTGRIITGIAAGMASFVVPLYIAEVAKTHRRGALGASNQLSIVIGIFLAYLIGNIETKALNSDKMVCNWRLITWCLVGVSALFGGAVFLIPETPRYLFSKSKTEQGEAALKQIRGGGERDSFMLERQELISSNDNQVEEEEAPSLMQYKKQLFIGCMLQVFQQFSGVNNLMFYLTQILKKANVENSEIYSVLITLTQVIVTAVSVWLMDKAGRRILLIFPLLGLALSMFMFSGYFFAAHGGHIVSQLAIAAAFLFFVNFSLGVGGIPWLILAELFPTSIRGQAASLATCVNWTGSFIVTKTFDPWVSLVTEQWAFASYGAICIAGAVFTFFFVPETKGKSLEEIEAEMKGGSANAEQQTREENPAAV